MVEVKESITSSCCGRFQISFEINKPLSRDNLKLFLDNGFIESKKFIDAGIFYVEDNNIIASCTFGSNRIEIKCKNKDKCQESSVKFKKALLMVE